MSYLSEDKLPKVSSSSDATTILSNNSQEKAAREDY